MLPFPLAGSRHAMKIANALTRPLRTAAANRAERTAFILVRPSAEAGARQSAAELIEHRR
ncbi:MAG: hypothetical protein DMG63_00325 [Acidobacteria bacterium]|nr:MAG: hypothetical protein DMG63_00325 [Acidobacteriota bacterium]